MRIGMRLLMGYFLIVAIAAWFVLSIFVQEIKPGVRRATEGTLIDTATLLAELAREDLLSADPQHGRLAQAFQTLHRQPINANIAGINKVRNEYHVYMTDAQGKVVFDSAGSALGQDYSRWNDVWLTLRGQYGARSTRSDPNDDNSSVMYIAAPVTDSGRIIGVLSVGKPNLAMAPVIKRSERRILWAGGALLGIALLIGAAMVWWINFSIGKLVRYADSVTADRPVPLPNLGGSELRKLAQALESMRLKLEGKNAIENYIYALTHELKSPLAAIRGAAEILREAPPPEVAARFTRNILAQNARMQSLVENLLQQARLENRLEIARRPVPVAELFHRLAEEREIALAAKKVTLRWQDTPLMVEGDRELLAQALGNLVDNAIDFTPSAGEILLGAEERDGGVLLTVCDTGCGIPDYALGRIFERFYSLPRENGQKSSGLGLAFVREVARLHQGDIQLVNRPEGGACALLRLHAHFT
ncbi:two-component system sensor histidine kinase CreC [Klebsiella michiganensis]|uniref:two-component system sensor histidine kinase CreC n=1 Tax=Klebsiella TaxID=570 RepID=UPI0012B964B5|nr:two-component system sensor histidine kinase CreC [Klebsiella michiganensis]ELT9689257.1 two-component system sensor histidine kinase CreC [Klebsiella michiganensis]MBA7860370.1 two-component system sensor histidine kinase CreC [Klebsiella michiganensis]MBA8054730.1 two-component system sensor histidine kinase CreC [Klebsiella michiganensis]MBE0113874.1 two-component system sensor histidine kinase CreC [Klebsiella michiganensis]MBL0775359.1 two-component system sensor histidine kinase CreC 